MDDVLSAARLGRAGKLRRAVKAFWASTPSALLYDPTESNQYDYFVEVRACIRGLGYRKRLACAGVLKELGEWKAECT